MNDIYFANKIYKGVNKTDWDFAKAIGEPSIYIVLGGLTSYPIEGVHQFVSGQYVQEGKDYELAFEVKFDSVWQRVLSKSYDAYKLNSMPTRIIAVPVEAKKPCPNCKETIQPCACMRNKCIKCGNPVGNTTFTVCDDCWDKKSATPPPPEGKGRTEVDGDLSIKVQHKIYEFLDYHQIKEPTFDVREIRDLAEECIKIAQTFNH